MEDLNIRLKKHFTHLQNKGENISCVDIDGKHLGKLPATLFCYEEIDFLGIGTTESNISPNSFLAKVFKNQESFSTFVMNHKR